MSPSPNSYSLRSFSVFPYLCSILCPPWLQPLATTPQVLLLVPSPCVLLLMSFSLWSPFPYPNLQSKPRSIYTPISPPCNLSTNINLITSSLHSSSPLFSLPSYLLLIFSHLDPLYVLQNTRTQDHISKLTFLDYRADRTQHLSGSTQSAQMCGCVASHPTFWDIQHPGLHNLHKLMAVLSVSVTLIY